MESSDVSFLLEKMEQMNVLVACELTGITRNAFRFRGCNAFSCDLLPSEDNSRYHMQMDALVAIESRRWDLVIAHPPCTDLASSGARWFEEKRKDGRQAQSIKFFESIRDLANENSTSYVIENPIGIMSTIWRKPDQIIQPWQYGDEATKTTCLWLKGLPKLKPTKVVGRGKRHVTKSGRSLPAWYNIPPTVKDRAKIRSRTFPGIAEAMADQWGTMEQMKGEEDE